MTTITQQRPNAFSRFLSLPTPVELVERDIDGSPWLKLANDWVKLASIINLWEMDGYREQQTPVIRMHFRATTQDGRNFLLFQDLLDGQWYCEFSLVAEAPDPSVPIYRA